jgi:ribosomal protein S3
VVSSLCDANQALQHQVLNLYEVNKALQQQVSSLASDLEKRDLEFGRREAEYQHAVSGLQSELSGIKQLISGELLAAKIACSECGEGALSDQAYPGRSQ